MEKTRNYKKYYESREFKEQYIYEGSDLGAVCTASSSSFKIWSPLADNITLNLYEDGDSTVARSFPMKRGKKGVWHYKIEKNCHNVYYDFTVEIDGTYTKTADPYAIACNCNGTRSMAVQLEKTDPDGWENDKAPEKTEEQVIYEIHIKDFSYDSASGVPEEYRGKYKAFTVEGTTLNGKGDKPTCLDYLKKLGITHVQLMPVFDFASVDEAHPEDYNWGYDPLNYNVPEGSYATDPFHGEVRIRELKELVMSLHKHGIRVIMDVVYNHTFKTDSWFSRTVPYYFYRQNEDGTYSNGSACGNDFATEREMCAKYILESVMYWAEEYHMDGFRFDLMGLLDIELINRIRYELDKRFGEGEILLYGEPWNAGTSPMEKGHTPCLKENIQYLDKHVGIFCDNTRDAVKGHVFFANEPGFVNGGSNCEKDILNAVSAWSEAGGKLYAKAPSQIITYVSAHDNLALWDKLLVTIKPGKPFTNRFEEVVRANKMAAAVYFTCQGSIFFLGGEEAARTKLGDDNSYASGAKKNQIDWQRVYEYEDILSYYRGLIALRKQMPGLFDKSEHAAKRIFDKEILRENVVKFYVDNTGNAWDTLAVCYNSTSEEQEFELPDGTWELLLDGNSSWLWKNPIQVQGTQEVEPVCVKLFGHKM